MTSIDNFIVTIENIKEETKRMRSYTRDYDNREIYLDGIRRANRDAESILLFLQKSNKLAAEASVKPETKMYWDSIICFLQQILKGYTRLECFGLKKETKNLIVDLSNTPIQFLEDSSSLYLIIQKLEHAFKDLMIEMGKVYSLCKKETVTPPFSAPCMQQTSDMIVLIRNVKPTEMLPLLEKIVMAYRDTMLHFVQLSNTFHRLD
jgi:hypothetical protein